METLTVFHRPSAPVSNPFLALRWPKTEPFAKGVAAAITVCGENSNQQIHAGRRILPHWWFPNGSSAPNSYCRGAAKDVQGIPARGVIVMAGHIIPELASRLQVFMMRLVDYLWGSALALTF